MNTPVPGYVLMHWIGSNPTSNTRLVACEYICIVAAVMLSVDSDCCTPCRRLQLLRAAADDVKGFFRETHFPCTH
jgi:hypothetical protein